MHKARKACLKEMQPLIKAHSTRTSQKAPLRFCRSRGFGESLGIFDRLLYSFQRHAVHIQGIAVADDLPGVSEKAGHIAISRQRPLACRIHGDGNIAGFRGDGFAPAIRNHAADAANEVGSRSHWPE